MKLKFLQVNYITYIFIHSERVWIHVMTKHFICKVSKPLKGTRCRGSDELVYKKKHLKPFVMKCMLERCCKSRKY